MKAQRLAPSNQLPQPDLPAAADYFGAPVDEIDNAEQYGLVPQPGLEAHRVSYLYLLVYETDPEYNKFDAKYGGIQIRARTFLWMDDHTGTPIALQKAMQHAAHRAANVFDTDVEEIVYDNYLTGFNAVEPRAEYPNWEVQRIAGSEIDTEPGIIDWSTEVYMEDGESLFAHLSGEAHGTANPWRTTTEPVPGREAVDIPPHKWEIGFAESRSDYYARPQGRTESASRYVSGAGSGKDVRINGEKVGSLGPKGRVWINPEYARGDGRTYRGNYSREGLVAETEATYQALRRGGTLYLTGETSDTVFLATARALPEGYTASDPDDVPVDLDPQAGRPPGEVTRLGIVDPAESIPIAGLVDREVITHLGYSTPPWRHRQGEEESYSWPGFLPITPDRLVVTDSRNDPDVDAGPNRTLDDFKDEIKQPAGDGDE
jgi:hypothetical protein